MACPTSDSGRIEEETLLFLLSLMDHSELQLHFYLIGSHHPLLAFGIVNYALKTLQLSPIYPRG